MMKSKYIVGILILVIVGIIFVSGCVQQPKEKLGCRKGTCADMPNEWFMQECRVEKCSCIECSTYPECWNAWTGLNCSIHEDCRDIYDTNYREAALGYVYKIDSTKDTQEKCKVE